MFLLRSLIACILLASASGAVAQDAEMNLDDEEARARLEAGEIAYAASRFEAALTDFQRAYELSERPELLYNIGLAADRLRRDNLAIESFERFLELRPGHSKAEFVRQRLELLRESSGAAQVEESPSRTGPWVTGIVGGAAVIGGGVLLGIAIADRNEIESLTQRTAWEEIEAQAASVPRRSGAGIALLSVGVAAAVSAVLWRVLTPREDLNVSVGAGRVCVEGRF